MKRLYVAFLIIFFMPLAASAQLLKNIDFGGGWNYTTGNQGLNGFNVSVAAHFSHRVALAVDYDGVYDTSNIGIFQITPGVGQVTSKSHLQDYMIGPRVYFPGLIKTKTAHLNVLNFFAAAQFGGSHLNTELIQAQTNSRVGQSDSAFAWTLGGGVEFRLTPHRSARSDLGLLRTHFADTGQSRLRFVLGVAYYLKARNK